MENDHNLTERCRAVHVTITPGLDQKLAVILTPTSNPGTSRWAKQLVRCGDEAHVVATLLHSQAAASDGLRPYPDGLRPYPDGGLRPHTPPYVLTHAGAGLN